MLCALDTVAVGWAESTNLEAALPQVYACGIQLGVEMTRVDYPLVVAGLWARAWWWVRDYTPVMQLFDPIFMD